MSEEVILYSNKELETYFSDDSTKMYIQEIRKYPLLSQEEIAVLISQYRAGDMNAREKIINHNLRLVLSVIKKMNRNTKHMQFLDLIQEGNIGLIRAIETYNPEKGKFSTYAWGWIRQKIGRGVADQDREVRLSEDMQSKLYKYQKLVNQCEQKNVSLPDDSDICDILDITQEQLQNIRETYKTNVISMNATIDEDEETELGYSLGVEESGYEGLLNSMVERDLFLVIKEVLSPLQYFIVYWRILSDERKTLEEVAKQFNLTRERIRQLEAKALKKVERYIVGNGKNFNNVLRKIRDREGTFYNALSLEPIAPSNIIKYFYVRNLLSEDERKLLKINLFSKYNKNPKIKMYLLGWDINFYDMVSSTLDAKIRMIFTDVKRYHRYKEMFIKNSGTRIFDLDLDEKNDVIDYAFLKEKYDSLSYDEVIAIVNRSGKIITLDEDRLLKRYFGTGCLTNMSKENIEREVNLLIFDYKPKNSLLPKAILQRTYIENRELFSDEQRAYLECYYFEMRDKSEYVTSYPKKTLFYRHYYLFEMLERLHYGVRHFSVNNFSKEEYLIVREKYFGRFTEERIKMLDMAYGVDCPVYSIGEMSEIFGYDYTKMHDLLRKARDFAISLYAGISNKLEFNKKLYIKYIKSKNYSFTDETRQILTWFVIEDKDYDEISMLTGLSKTRISNIVTDGLRKIDFYRFGITTPLVVKKKELDAFFKWTTGQFTVLEKRIIGLKVLEKQENGAIAERLKVNIEVVKRLITRFYKLYTTYQIKDVTMDARDIFEELLLHRSESVLSEREREFASYYIGMKNEYNPEGIQLDREAMIKHFNYTKNVYYKIYMGISTAIRGKKADVIKSELGFIPRCKLELIMRDPHLPISEKEKTIICHLFELEGYSYKNLDDISLDFGEKKDTIRRRYYRAIVTINKYLNKEIEGVITYEEDIAPILRYFGYSDRRYIEDFYKNKMTYEEMAKKYGMSFNKIVDIFNRLKTSIHDILNNPRSKKFDFDYYMSVVDKDDFPFYGDKVLAKQIFDLYFGMVGNDRLSVPQIIEKLNLSFNSTATLKCIYNMMIGSCKYRDGMRKGKSFTYEQVVAYYEKHCGEMNVQSKLFYERYFALQNKKMINYSKERMSGKIIYDLIRENYPDYFNLDTATREEVIDILKKYWHQMSKRVRNELMALYEINERIFMNGRDINHIYRLLDQVEMRLLLTDDSKQLTLQNN